MIRPRHATQLETLSVTVAESAVPLFESALATVCTTVGIFEADDDHRNWRVEGVRDQGHREDELQSALEVARLLSGHDAPLHQQATHSEGWLARIYEAFPPQEIGRRFTICGTHLDAQRAPGRHVITLDAGIAFGSGEHGSTRGCLRGFEKVAYRRPRRILDMGCGSGILAMAAVKHLHRPALAADIDPWSVRVTRSNARLNGLRNMIQAVQGQGWSTPAVRRSRNFDLIFANILARPLCLMARDLTAKLKRGGTTILAGLLTSQANMVLAAYRRQGLVLERRIYEGEWCTLILRKPA